VFLNCSIIVNTQIKFQTAKGGSRADNQDSILKELTTLGAMVLEINTKMNSMITKEEFQNKFEKLRLRAFKASVVTRGRRPIIYFPFWS
jgi:hypothetical protein